MSTRLSAGISPAYLDAKTHLAAENIAFVLTLKSDDENGNGTSAVASTPRPKPADTRNYRAASGRVLAQDHHAALRLAADTADQGDEPGTIERELSGTLESRQVGRLVPDDGLAGMQAALAVNCATDQETLKRVVDALRVGMAEPLLLLPGEQIAVPCQDADEPRN